MKEYWKFIILIAVFLIFYFLPVDRIGFQGPILESLAMTHDYAREHVLLCLVPAFFIAGAIAVFIKQESVIRYFGANANKWLSYSVASISGTILAVCSCTVLPLFAGIYMNGAGIGPASAFLYSGPAINILAIILTARVLGFSLGIGRALGAILFSVIIGLLLAMIFKKDERARNQNFVSLPDCDDSNGRPLWLITIYFASMVGILVFANWAKPLDTNSNWAIIYLWKWYITFFFSLVLALILYFRFTKEELIHWVKTSWDYAKMILPLLLVGVLVAGLLLGRPEHEGLIPSEWVENLVGGNSLFANFFASISGSLMYFATLTEVPILQGLIGSGMGKGPALALLLAGPALSLPSMIVIRQIMGTQKMLVFVSLVVVLSTFVGWIYGILPY